MEKYYQPHMNKDEGQKKRHGVIIYPDHVGPYTIKDTIGEGAFSIVKLTYHELYHQYYACKIVPLKMLDERNLLERFELEIRISQIMRHPRVAAITDVLKDENNFYIFMEYYPNGSLLNYIIKKRRIKENEAKGIMYQIFDALEYIHSQGVCHRDLKPENIIIDNSGHIRISDFGFSQFVDQNNLVKTACGSPCYVSPEVVSGEKYNGLIADVWSAGVVLYAVVTGMLPWTKKSVKEILYQIRKGEYKIPRFVSEQCRNLISLLIKVDPLERISLKEAKNHTWFGIKSEDDRKALYNFSIPKKFLKKMPELDKNAQYQISNQVPYLSTRKVDIYFRPDIDYDFDNQFKDINNIHAINNSINGNRCDVSMPYLEFDKAIKLLNESTKHLLKFRKRVVDKYSENLDLKTGSNIKIRSLSTGKLIISNKENNEIEASKLQKEKSDSYFTINTVKIVKDSAKQQQKKVKIVKYHRKSAGLPK